MINRNNGFEIFCEPGLDPETFKNEFLNKYRPVIIPNAFSDSGACRKWSLDYFAEQIPDMKFIAKHLDIMDQNTAAKMEEWEMGQYISALNQYASLNEQERKSTPRPPYCHDIPLFKLKPQLIADMESFPTAFIPEFYQKNWWDYIQFFMSPKGSVTPLHFDSLCTHNLFFQVRGTKLFTIYPMEDWKHCYRYNWKWFEVDPENPDLDLHPEYTHASPIQVTVNSGDILLLPSGTMHHVRSLEESFSFNIDFHTPESVTRALCDLPADQPKEVYYYNSLIALGLKADIPPEIVYPRYENYLFYTG
ncbi:cupin-like domain-containing protein [Thalassomonas viridans]|uniref:Cupin-like domain-containing protein n=1 Tax=Thalassomonas viridans TaxID=137584 RepID=A0AAE9ZBA0_9GAMM|nr:cupin-like domain-containing protein [Thalassomonas viridans]WDE09189.1 cupin-like domain-containing protein [Thalassomonas viridans]